MSAPSDPVPTAAEHGFLAPRPDSGPADHCFRCGVETPPGVGLCELHNRGQLRGPSATQMHFTIFAGIALAVVALFFLANLTVTTSGPFSSTVTSAVASADGGVSLAFTITNDGTTGVPDCRVTRDGVPRPDDLAFRVSSLAAGESVSLEQELAPPPTRPAYDLESLTVVCS